VTLNRLDLDVAAQAEKTLEDLRAASRDGVPAEVFSRLKGLPVMLRTSGVLATLAFYSAKSDPATKLGAAYRAVSAALHAQLGAGLGMPLARVELYKTLKQQDTADLLKAFARVEAYATWLRRLAEALEHEQNSKKPTGVSGIPPAEADEPEVSGG